MANTDMRMYIGARYVPRFMGEYVASQAYEGLDIVDDGVGVAYIAKKPVPVNTPLSNTEYWMVYFTYGGIEDLQQQINAINEDISDMKDGTVEGSLQNQIDATDEEIADMKDSTVEGSLQSQIDDIDSVLSSKYLLSYSATVSVSADGVKTYGTLFHELMTALTTYGNNHANEYFRLKSLVVSVALVNLGNASANFYKGDSLPSSISANGTTVSANALIARSITLSSTAASNKYMYYTTNDTPPVTDMTAQVPASGTFSIRFDAYIKTA